MKPRLQILRRISPKLFVVVGIGALLLLLGSFLVDVRIVVERPRLGDVSRFVGIVWQASLAIATLGSFLLAYRNYAAKNRSSDGSALGFEIRGRNHDIDFHLHVAGLSEPEDDSGQTRDRTHEEDDETNQETGSSQDSTDSST